MRKLIKPMAALMLSAVLLTTFGCGSDTLDETAESTTDTAPSTDNTEIENSDPAEFNGIVLTTADNPWLLWEVEFPYTDGEYVTKISHPNLAGQTVVPTFSYSGNKLMWNGAEFNPGDSVKILDVNTVTVSDSSGTVKEYTVKVTDKDRNIPTVIIDTAGVVIADKLNYVDAKITVLDSENSIYNAEAGIKLRGNSTMGYDKKPYRIKFEEKQDVLGIAEAKSWVLLANYLDPSAMRGQLAFGLAARINANTAEETGYTVFSPRMKPVEVYLNGSYIGMYDMGDHMQVDKTRINIDESGDDGATEGDVGYFVEVEVKSRVLTEGVPGYEDWSDYSYIDNVGSTSAGQDNQLYFQFKLPEEPSAEQKAFITNELQIINDLILAGDDAAFDHIDLDSMIDWYIVNELFKNTDSHMQSSVYFYKDKGGKVYMGPVWDFDLSSGSQIGGGYKLDDPTGFWTRGTEYCGWFNALYQNETFTTALYSRWAELRDEGIIDAIFTDMDSFVTNFGYAAQVDYNIWNENYVMVVGGESSYFDIPDVAYTNSWNNQVEYLRSFLTKRIDWLDGQYGYVKAAA